MQPRNKEHKQRRTIQKILKYHGYTEELDLFWRHSDCDIAVKVYTADAILRAKLLYGLESAQLIPSVAKRMETLQLKVLRKNLRLNTTYIDRENNNESISDRTNQEIKEQHISKKEKNDTIHRSIQKTETETSMQDN